MALLPVISDPLHLFNVEQTLLHHQFKRHPMLAAYGPRWRGRSDR